MPEIKIDLTKKQSEAFRYLTDKTTQIVVFGSGKGSGKSVTGVVWITYLCLKYPGVRCLIGRTRLSELRITTLRTLLEFFNTCGLTSEHYAYNQQLSEVKFFNGSEIILKDLADTPSDPEFQTLAGLELTAIFVDEASQISRKCFDILTTLLRYKLIENNLIPRMFLSCNPGTNFLRTEFYQPWKDGILPEKYKFVFALPTDNPHLPPEYVEILRNLPEKSKRRLFNGDWSYNESDDDLFEIDSITMSLFRNQPKQNDKKYLSVDVARFGSDNSVIILWIGLTIIDIFLYSKLSTTELNGELKSLSKQHNIPPSQIVIDSDGVGSGVADMNRGCFNFVNNGSPLFGQNFNNLKSQCYVRLSEVFGNGEISININDNEIIDRLTNELITVRLKNTDKDGKIQIIPKDEMKKMLGGKSPDISDAMAMGMVFHLNNQNKPTGKYVIPMRL